MKIPEFKPSKHFLGVTDLPCLVAKVKNSKLPGVATRHISEFKESPACEIYLRGKDPSKISKWQQEMLEKLLAQEGLAAAIEEGMKEYEKSSDAYCDFSKREQAFAKKHGIAPFITISMIVIDDIQRDVIFAAHTIYDGNLDEHGISIYLKKGRWRFDDGDRFCRYSGKIIDREEKRQRNIRLARWKAVFPLPPKGARVETDISPLYGVWRYNAAETAKVLKQCGAPKSEIDEAISPTNPSLTSGWYYSRTGHECLENGYTRVKWNVAKYKRKGMLYYIYTKSGVGGDSNLWCDGKRMSSIGGKDVYTRVKDSYRRGKEVSYRSSRKRTISVKQKSARRKEAAADRKALKEMDEEFNELWAEFLKESKS